MKFYAFFSTICIIFMLSYCPMISFFDFFLLSYCQYQYYIVFNLISNFFVWLILKEKHTFERIIYAWMYMNYYKRLLSSSPLHFNTFHQLQPANRRAGNLTYNSCSLQLWMVHSKIQNITSDQEKNAREESTGLLRWGAEKGGAK